MGKGKRQQEVKNVHVNKYAKKAENKGPKPAEMEAQHPGWMDEQCKKAVEQRDGIKRIPDLPRLSGYDPGYSARSESVYERMRRFGIP